jgi:hypothetical protein
MEEGLLYFVYNNLHVFLHWFAGFVDSSVLNMEAAYSSETSFDSQLTTCHYDQKSEPLITIVVRTTILKHFLNDLQKTSDDSGHEIFPNAPPPIQTLSISAS